MWDTHISGHPGAIIGFHRNLLEAETRGILLPQQLHLWLNRWLLPAQQLFHLLTQQPPPFLGIVVPGGQ